MTLPSMLVALALSPTPDCAPGVVCDADADAGALRGRRGDRTIYVYEEDDVIGDLPRPGAEPIWSRATVRHASLLQIRAHFVPELIRMGNDL